jgi:hypothetical protein
MGFDRIADRKIREAMQEGEFDNLPNRGRPIDLDEYFKWPADLRMAYSVLKSAGCVPEEVELLNEIAALERTLGEALREDERARLRKTIDSRRTQLNIALERAKRR